MYGAFKHCVQALCCWAVNDGPGMRKDSCDPHLHSSTPPHTDLMYAASFTSAHKPGSASRTSTTGFKIRGTCQTRRVIFRSALCRPLSPRGCEPHMH